MPLEINQTEARRRVKQMETIVADVVRETVDTVTLVLFTGNDRLEYQPGHFLTIDPHQFPALAGYTRFLEDQKGKREPPRAYSMSSSPHEKRLAITVKEEPYEPGRTAFPPLLSPFLVHGLRACEPLVVTGFTGPYVMPPDLEERADVVLHVVAGSGSVPNFSMLKFDLATRRRLRHLVLYSSKTLDDVIFRREIDRLAAESPERLAVHYLLTREPDATRHGAHCHAGRITRDLLERTVGEFGCDLDRVEAFLCGPGLTVYDKRAAAARGEVAAPRFLESAIRLCEEIGIPRRKIHHESYG